MSKILAIEPHADDLFISVGWTLDAMIKAGHEVTTLTVFGDERRQKEAQEYARLLGAEHRALQLPESGSMDGEVDKRALHDAIVALDSSFSQIFDQVWCPLGIYHEEHKAVRRAVDTLFKNPIYYLDMPYAVKEKNRIEANEAIRKRHVISLIAPTPRKWKGAELIFKSQSAFFHFERDNLLRCWEMLVR